MEDQQTDPQCSTHSPSVEHTEFLSEEPSNLRHNAALSQVFPCRDRKACHFGWQTRSIVKEETHFGALAKEPERPRFVKNVGKVAFPLCLQHLKAVWKNCSPLFRLFRELSVEKWEGNKGSVFGGKACGGVLSNRHRPESPPPNRSFQAGGRNRHRHFKMFSHPAKLDGPTVP